MIVLSKPVLITLLIVGILLSLALLACLYRAIQVWHEVASENKHRLRPRIRESAKKKSWFLPLIVTLKVVALLGIIFVADWAKLLSHHSFAGGVALMVLTVLGALAIFFIIPPSFFGDNDLKTKLLPPFVVTCCFFLLMSHAMAMYSGLTLKGDNVALSFSYHGPARIVGYQRDDDSGYPITSSLTVTYGGGWACPDSDGEETYCEVPLELNWCDYYDSTKMWATSDYGAPGRTWRETDDGVDLWRGYFTCASGFAGDNNENQNNGDDDNGENDGGVYYDEDERTYDVTTAPVSGDGWPYLVNIFGDCTGRCADASVDTPVTRDWVYRVERYKVRMGVGAIVGILASIVTLFTWCRFNNNKAEGDVDQKTFVLIPPQEDNKEVA